MRITVLRRLEDAMFGRPTSMTDSEDAGRAYAALLGCPDLQLSALAVMDEMARTHSPHEVAGRGAGR